MTSFQRSVLRWLIAAAILGSVTTGANGPITGDVERPANSETKLTAVLSAKGNDMAELRSSC